jgi:hypothetical protein
VDAVPLSVLTKLSRSFNQSIYGHVCGEPVRWNTERLAQPDRRSPTYCRA